MRSSIRPSCAAQAKQAKDQLLRSLADMENLRQRSAQQIDTNRKFAVQVGRVHGHTLQGFGL
jgi:molecular chaperone GrpE (heat shock protein)